MKHTWTKDTALAAIVKHSGLTYCSAYDYLRRKHSDDTDVALALADIKRTMNIAKVTK
jgi:hypothetical protein